MTKTSASRLVILAAAAASSLALTFPAFGATRPDDRSGVRGPGETVVPTQTVGGDPGMSARPDNRAGTLGVGADSTDTAVGAGTTGSFDWTDAGIGAGIGAGALTLLGFAALVALPARRTRTAA
jgi:hypothetical protein